MRLVHLSQIRTGMIIARPIYGNKGQKLINDGAEIKDQFIDYLRQLGISQVYVHDERVDDVLADDIVTDETREQCRSAARELINRSGQSGVPGNNTIIEERVGRSVDNLFEELIKSSNTCLKLADIRAADNYTFEHCLNVTILSIVTATKLKYPQAIIKKMAPGILLHDLGLTKIPESILKKKGRLTDEEIGIIKQHPVQGYELFRKTALFSENAGEIVYQHHERIKGQGYPEGRIQNEINWMAQIVAIADTYDALTSYRPYRNSFRPKEAIDIISRESGTAYNPEIIEAFLSFVSAYPLGSHVVFNNGEGGIVVGNTAGFTFRPKVRVLFDPDNNPHLSPYEVDLQEREDLCVIREIVTSQNGKKKYSQVVNSK